MKLKKYAISLFTAFVLVLSLSFNVYAAGFSAKASASSVKPGGSFKVTFGSGCTGRFDVSASNGSVSASNIWVEGGAGSVTVKAGSSGTVTVTVTATSVSDASYNDVTGSQSVSVAITASAPASSGGSSTPAAVDNRSKENALKSLTVSAGELSPKFSANTKKYEVSLPNTATEISIDAAAKDSKAKVSGTGKKSVKPGNNEFSITCTAENGSKNAYLINVKVDETPIVFLDYNGSKLGVVRNLDAVATPEGFTKETTTIDNNEVSIFNQTNAGVSALYMVDEEGNKGFYIYKDNAVTSRIIPTALLGQNVYIVDLDNKQQSISGMTYTDIKVDNVDLKGFTFNDQGLANYNVVRVMNEQGEMVDYLYEINANAMIPYAGQMITEDSYKALTDKSMIIIVSSIAGIGVIGCGILLFLMYKDKNLFHK